MARRQAVRGGDGDYPSIARRQAARTSVETQAGEKLVRGGGGGGGGALGAGQAGALTPGALSLRKWMACADVYKKARAMYGTLP